jgi:predicted dehydrogenase
MEPGSHRRGKTRPVRETVRRKRGRSQRSARDAGKRAGVKVVDGFHYLYHPVTKRIHGLVASGELGELQRVETMVMIRPPPPEDHRWSLLLAGGALMYLGCYSLHAIRAMAT